MSRRPLFVAAGTALPPRTLAVDGNVAGAPSHGAHEVLPLLLEETPDALRLVEVSGG